MSGLADGVHVCHYGPVAEESQDGKDTGHQANHWEDHDEETGQCEIADQLGVIGRKIVVDSVRFLEARQLRFWPAGEPLGDVREDEIEAQVIGQYSTGSVDDDATGDEAAVNQEEETVQAEIFTVQLAGQE